MRVLEKNNNFEFVLLENEHVKLGEIFKGMLQLFPDNEKFKDGLDGFFIAALKKNKIMINLLKKLKIIFFLKVIFITL